jgi:polyhydroxybutyrate depolymerase
MRAARTLSVLCAPLVLVAAACADEPAPPQVAGDRPAVDVPEGACPEPSPAEPGTRERTVRIGDEERVYLLTVPAGHDGREPAPVLLNLHGLQSDAEDQLDYARFEDGVDGTGFVVATPDGGGLVSGWRLPDGDDDEGAVEDIAFVEAVLADVADELCVDPDRTFAAGISNGAALSTVLACELADRITGVGAVAGVNLVAPCPDGEPVPLVAFHGTDDDVVPWDGGSVLFGLAEALPVEDAVAAWAERNGCSDEVTEERVGDEVVHRVWDGCPDDATVELFVVDDGGHTWPGSEEVDFLGHVTDDVDATAVLLDRFAQW